MPAAALPKNENERLAGLSALRILDTQGTADFDLFPELASALFSAPMAAISLIDRDRQWFKASVGLDVVETPRESSFCAHAILDPTGMLCVPDATRDPRFADNPDVVGGPGLRFYAGSPIIGPDGHAVGALCIMDTRPREPSEQMLAQLRKLALAASGALNLHALLQKQHRLATIDPLTGLDNRAGLDRILHEELQQAPAGPGHSLALLFLDLDNFRNVNDLFGHGGGDDALREVASRLARVTRGSDTLGRFGEDKFYVLAKGVPGDDILLAMGRRIHAAFAEPFTVQHQPVPLGTSIGIAVSGEDTASAETLLHRADIALHEAKRSGGGVTRLESGEAGRIPLATGRQRVEALLREALVPAGREPFALALQPIFEGASGRLAGFEALVRWPQPDGHVLPPSEFIPVAEATGLVVQLDRWVLDQACGLAATWPEHIRISSNLSAANFYAVGLVREVERTLVRHGLAPDRLKLEITETVLLRDPDRVRKMIADLRRLGVHVVLDDFGSGHASLAYLRDYAFDGLKIDSSFTAEIESGTKGRAFLRAIIDMAEAMGIDTTAEGVETDGQLRQLCEGNVRFIQGFLLGRPMTPDAAMALVRAQHDPEHPQWAAAD